MDLSKFYVVTMISNPVRYKSRYKLYEKFARHMHETGIKLYTCENQQGHREHETQTIFHNHEHHLLLRTRHELWYKENALNLMVQRLPSDWEYVCWIDADIEFNNWRMGENSWYEETWQALQNHQIVQLFQNAVDLGPTGEIVQTHQGFAYSYVTGRPEGKGYTHWHPGFAWGCRRDAWNGMGGLFQDAILGAGDNHMAHAWIGRVRESVNPQASGPYFRKLDCYQARCEPTIRRDIGFVPGTIFHGWHGKKKDRRYWDRWKILTETKFDPDWDLKTDHQGLLQLHDHHDLRSIVIRDKIRQYFRSRHEDSIDLE